MYHAAIEILKKINASGYQAYVVGGFVRDLYLNRHSIDVDICTDATPKELKNIFGEIMLPNIQYGSVTVIYKRTRFEITTFRRDLKYENNRLPVQIEYIHSLIEDLQRRDFTINTLCLDANGELIDLLDAKKDLDDKMLKMVGDPNVKLEEDCLRILRAVRFATILNFKIDDELKRYIKKYGYLLKKLSYYRKKEELEKIFTSNNVNYGISLLKELCLVEYLELFNIDNIKITTSIISIWAQLGVLNIYSFSNHEKDTIIKINELMDKNILDSHNLYHYGLYITSLVGEIKGVSKKIITKKYNDLPIKSLQEININGKQISEILEKKSGKYIKDILCLIEDKIINNDLKNDYDDIKLFIIENRQLF